MCWSLTAGVSSPILSVTSQKASSTNAKVPAKIKKWLEELPHFHLQLNLCGAEKDPLQVAYRTTQESIDRTFYSLIRLD